MNDTFIYDGVSSDDFDTYVASSNFLDGATRDVTSVAVPGRNGDLIISNNRFKNYPLTENVYIKSDIIDNVELLKSFLGKHMDSYFVLEESLYPDVYRLARVSEGFSIDSYDRNSGAFSIHFDCKPQKFLKSGETPLQFFPVLVSSTTWYSPYVPVNGTLRFTATTSSTLSVTLYTFNASGTQQSSTSYSCANGAEKTKTFTSNDKYWMLEITGRSSTDTCYLTIVGNTTIDGKTVALNAKFGRNFTITNPTGYPAKPLIEFYSRSLVSMGVDNYKDNVRQEWYSFRSNQMANGANHGFLDCELQYLYDSTGANQTDKLVLTTAQAIAHSMVFPEFTGDSIELQMYKILASSIDDGCGLIQIYPNWWTV